MEKKQASTKYSRKMISEYVSTSDERTQIVWKLFPCLHFPKHINRATILTSALPGWCISSLCASELHFLGQLPFKRRRRSTLLHGWYVSSSLTLCPDPTDTVLALLKILASTKMCFYAQLNRAPDKIYTLLKQSLFWCFDFFFPFANKKSLF